jgi:MFS family permease
MQCGWGLVTICQCWIHGRGQLIGSRLLIGAFEAGFYPTAVAYLSTFYTRYDLAVRLALFYGQYAIAGAFSSAIAYGVFQIHGGPLRGWQYLFVIEGSITCLLALLAVIWLPSAPSSAWFLSFAEREAACRRMAQDTSPDEDQVCSNGNVSGGASAQMRLTRRDVTETICDWKLWYILVFNICASVPSQAFSVFLPLVVQGLGYSSLQANLMSVPPYVCGAVGLYLFAFSSDHFRERGFHSAVGIFVGLIGLIVVVTAGTNAAKYAGLCVFLFGSYVAAPLTVAWLSGNTPEAGKRSLVLGVNGWGNLAGVVGSQLYRSEFAPRYLVPFYATLGFVAAALLGFVAYRYTLAAVNRVRERKLSHLSAAQVEAERTDDVRYADRKWTFVYGL